ncbi:MAG TPA: DUF488 domain-containing protein [Solirubrobacteraceae bacterium]|nr:DUF488 domain-containing protein [Solirubrobacteraceae bacterium]
MPERRAFTIGHSSHAIDAFVGLLRDGGVRAVADVRRFPGSRRHPQFAREALAAELRAAGIAYTHLEALGGRRAVRPGSPNDGWQVSGFQGYADHMASAAFAAGLGALEALATELPTAVMCAEALWWQCHRRLVADALVARGWTVEHIGPDGGRTVHELTPFAVPGEAGTLSYPAAQLRLR